MCSSRRTLPTCVVLWASPSQSTCVKEGWLMIATDQWFDRGFRKKVFQPATRRLLPGSFNGRIDFLMPALPSLRHRPCPGDTNPWERRRKNPSQTTVRSYRSCRALLPQRKVSRRSDFGIRRRGFLVCSSSASHVCLHACKDEAKRFVCISW